MASPSPSLEAYEDEDNNGDLMMMGMSILALSVMMK